jgi:hypothetical protein
VSQPPPGHGAIAVKDLKERIEGVDCAERLELNRLIRRRSTA